MISKQPVLFINFVEEPHNSRIYTQEDGSVCAFS